MASAHHCLAALARLSLTPSTRPLAASVPRFLAPAISVPQMRHASMKKKVVKKKKGYKTFKTWDLTTAEQYSLCDAIRYIRAAEVGLPPRSVKYELHIHLKTMRNGPVVRSRIRLPHPVKTDTRIAVICPEGSDIAQEALSLGAVMVGEESLFALIRDGSDVDKLPFTRLICHRDSERKLQQAGLGRILGPRGLLPNKKNETVTANVAGLLRNMVGADEYRERTGVVRLPVGQLGFTPAMVAENVRAFVGKVKTDVNRLRDKHESIEKGVDEIVLSSTHGPGFSLNGSFNPTNPDLEVEALTGPM